MSRAGPQELDDRHSESNPNTAPGAPRACSNTPISAVRYKRGLRPPACRVFSPSLHQAKVLQGNLDLCLYIVHNQPHDPGIKGILK